LLRDVEFTDSNICNDKHREAFMSKSETIKTLLWGAVGGAILVVAVGFGSGWLVTGSSREAAVQTAWVESQASVCASLVQAHRQEVGNMADLSGYQARTARDSFAATFAVTLQGHDVADPAVIRACSRLLDKKNV